MTHNSFHRYAMTVALCLCICIFTTALCQDAAAFSLVLYAQSGQMPSIPATDPTNFTTPTEITQPPVPTETEPEAVVSFSPEELVEVYYQCGVDVDPEALLCGGLRWDLTGEAPTVLIVHTHTTEGFIDTYDRMNFRTRDEEGNILAIGAEVARVLALGGITVLQDRTIQDDPDYNSAYAATRRTIESYLQRYPSIQLVLDLHRDAADGDKPLVTAATVGGQNSARLALVMGTNFQGWEQNFGLALKLFALLERENEGITRPISVRAKTYNLDLCPGSLLVEVGGTGNTKQEALIAANALANAILELSRGSINAPLT